MLKRCDVEDPTASRLHIERVCHLRQAQAGFLWSTCFPGAPNLGQTPAADCSDKVASWGKDGPSIELVIYPGAYHGFYCQHLQPGTRTFEHWLEYNGEAADSARRRLLQFLDRHLN